MKTEHHAVAHAQKAARGNSIPKVANGIKPGAGGAQADVPGGFLSVLSSLDSDQAVLIPTTAELQGALLPNGSDGSDKLTGDRELFSNDAGQSDQGMLLAQLGQGFMASPAATVKAETVGAGSSGKPGKLARAGLNIGEAADETLALKGQGPSDVQADTSLSDVRGKLELAADTKNSLLIDLARAKLDNAHSQARSAALEVKADRLSQGVEIKELSNMAAQINLGGNLDSSIRQIERSNTKLASTRASDGVDGVLGPQGFYSANPLGVAPTTAASPVVAPELMVAEQVNYWISKDVQNAELKLDGFDGLPVEVSITLQGNEARVDFRTDQEGIREVLQNTESHLKDILAREGLVLSGVSIGTSMQNSQNPQERKAPEIKRRIEIQTADVSPIGSMKRSSAVAGKSIDVFV